ncbi:MAG TPA: ABC transporter ATP-binding protein [Actinomycetota bacterium]|jgi:ABC-2 type transport system ATP-binding protein
MGAAISVQDLRKRYADVEAVRGISFEVPDGSVFALLGPNGAGKTTTVEICEGFRSRTSGRVQVLGHDPVTGPRALKARIGIVLQSTGVDLYLTVAETIELYRRYYPNPRPVDEIVDVVGLREKRDTRVGKLSGGQQRRLDVAVALAGDPELLFLDEPTTGFDPAARRGAWDMVRNLKGLGKTILLTTHYMDEAQALADEVAVIARGEIVAHGTPATLGGRDTARTTISFRARGKLPAPLDGKATRAGERVTIASEDPTGDLHALTSWAMETGAKLDALEVSRPTLEDVYLEITGGEAGEER